MLWKIIYPIERGIFERNFGTLVDLLHHNQKKDNTFSQESKSHNIFFVFIHSKGKCCPATGQAGIVERQKYSSTDTRRRRCRDGVVSPLSGRILSGKDRIVQEAEWVCTARKIHPIRSSSLNLASRK
jgi:hypothetical protein